MRKYNATIVETQTGRAEFEADSYTEALKKARECYDNGDVIWCQSEVSKISLNDEPLEHNARVVTEWCSFCENEIELKWDVDGQGYKAFCPVCGNRLMLCDECQHSENCSAGCDFNSETDSCKHNPPTKQDVEHFELLRKYIGQKLKVVGCNGCYSVKTLEDQTVLSNYENGVAAIHCDTAKLEPHVGHDVLCVCYGDADLLWDVSVECVDCCEVIFDKSNPEIAGHDDSE